MSENTVELIIRARDEASKSLQAVERGLQGIAPAADRAGGGAVRLDTSLSQTTRTARLFGVVLLSDLSPGLGRLVQNMTLATAGARFMGQGFAAVAGAITGVALAAFAAYISSVVDASKKQAEMNLAVASFDPGPMRSRLKEFTVELGRSADEWKRFNESSIFSASIFQSLAAGVQITVRSLAELFGKKPAEEIADLTANLAKAAGPEHEINLLKQQQAWIALETSISASRVKTKGFVDEQDRLDQVLIRGIERERATATAIITAQEGIDVAKALAGKRDVEVANIAKIAAGDRVTAEQKAEAEITKITAAAADRKRLFLQTGVSEEMALGRKREAARLAVLEEGLEGERAILLKRLQLTAKFARDEGEQATAGIQVGFMALEDQVGAFGQRASTAVQGIGRAMFDALDDSFFSVATGKFSDLGDIAKRAGEDMLKSFIGVLTGPLKQSILKSFAELFGIRASPGFSLASLGAVAPGAPSGIQFGGVSPADIPQVAGPSFSPGTAAEIEARGAGGLFTTEAPGAFLGGLAGVGIGALGLLGASQAQHPLTGALSGGLGGLSAGLGLATLGLGASAVLGPIGLVAGLAFGIFSGGRGRSKRKREERRRQRAAAQIALIQAADTLAELERLSTIGLEPEAAEALRQQATPLILEAGRREIGGTASLAGIEAILARGVSPDVGGGELRAEAERRRLEILGGLEAIEAIGIEEQLEGGVRRRTIVGAGAFGLARARGTEGELVLSREAIRRLAVEELTTNDAVLERLFHALGRWAVGRGIRFSQIDRFP